MAQNNIFIGIDPGKSGFISLYNPLNDSFIFYAMPTHKVETGSKLKSGKEETKSEFNPAGLLDIAIDIRNQYPAKEFRIIAAIEEVNGRQGWSAENNFNFGHTAGLQLMLLIILRAEIEFVRPQKWQSLMYHGFQKVMVPSSTGKTKVHDTKATSAIVSAALRPDIDFRRTERAKNIDDNKTDACLITLYRLKTFKEKFGT